MDARGAGVELDTGRVVAERRAGLRRAELRWATGRLVAFLAIPASLILLSSVASWGLGLLFAVVFGWTVRVHGRIRGERELVDRELVLLAESARRAGGAVVLIRGGHRPADAAADAGLTPVLGDGETWALTEQERDDLDLYAEPVGVFGLLNRASSGAGARRLRDMMERPCVEAERIRARQPCVQWLDGHADAHRRLMAAAAQFRGRDAGFEQLIKAVRTATAPAWWRMAAWIRVASVAVAIVILVLAARAMNGALGTGGAALAILGLNYAVYLRMKHSLRACIEPWEETASAAMALRDLARVGAETLPNETELGVLRDKFAAASGTLRGLCRWLPWSESGGPMHAVFNALIFWDVHIAALILRHVLVHRAALLEAAATAVELEALASLACFAREQPQRCYATFTDERRIVVERGRHPLIEPARVVANDLRLDGALRTWIITGSNAAGKSTYLRMVGINVLLAQMGAPSCAAAVELSPVNLMTDLRARDSLAAAESYFLAEVRHVRRMVFPPEGRTPTLGLIDEPFRGTNSLERVAASMAVARHLIASEHFFLIATHEEGLTDLPDDRQAANFHFEENLAESGTVFDYVLRTGRATTRNALRVMAREGYPKGLLAEAQAWVQSKAEGP